MKDWEEFDQKLNREGYNETEHWEEYDEYQSKHSKSIIKKSISVFVWILLAGLGIIFVVGMVWEG